jgi:hypothetical protein
MAILERKHERMTEKETSITGGTLVKVFVWTFHPPVAGFAFSRLGEMLDPDA